MAFIFCTACPDAPFIRLSIAENMINLSFILVLQIEISQLLVLRTLPDPSSEFSFKILMNFESL